MTSLANFDIQKHNDETKKSIKNLDKPLSSFNYYIKEMRENWNNLSEDDKDKYILNFLLNSRLVHLSYKCTKIKFRDHLLVMILIVFPTAYEMKYFSLKYLTKCLTDKKYRWIFYSFYYYFKRVFLFYKMVMLYRVNRYDLPYFH